jgi:DNA-binding transcriptional LysR family regulator
MSTTTPGFSELNAVAAVAARRSFRAAAADLGVSTSALSHSIAALEARLGVRLFHRTTRSVALTAAGESFLARIEPALRAIAEAMEGVNEHRDLPTGLLRINASDVAAEQMLAPIVIEFLRRHPDMQVEIATEIRPVDIVAGGFDGGVRLSEMVPQDMVSIPVGGDQQHVVVGSPHYFKDRRHPRTPADLANHGCIRFRLGRGSIYRWQFERRGEAISIDVDGPLTLDHPHLILSAAIAGAGLAYVSAWIARDALADGRVVRVLADWTPPYPGLRFYYPRHRHVTAGLRAFVALLRENSPR